MSDKIILIDFLYRTILKLNLYNKIYSTQKEYMLNKNKKVIYDLQQYISSQLDRMDTIEDKLIVDILINLSDIIITDSTQLINLLSECYLKLTTKQFSFDSVLKNEIPLIQHEINEIYKRIKQSKYNESIKQDFNFLEKIQMLLYKLIFQENVAVSEELRKFVYDYERIDDENEKIRLYNQITKMNIS